MTSLDKRIEQLNQELAHLLRLHEGRVIQKPATTSIRLLHPQLHLKSGATGANTVGITAGHPFPVIRMNEPTGSKNPSGGLQPLFKTKAEVIERNAVGINRFAAGSEYRNNLRRKVQNLP